MNILILLSAIKYSGASKIATWLANKLIENGYQVYFVTFIDEDDKRQLSNNIYRFRICIGEKNRFKRVIKAIINIRKINKDNNVDLIISFLPLEGLIAVLSTLFSKTKCIVSERSDPFFEKTAVSSISRFFFRFADGAVFQSSGAQSFFSKKLQERSVIIQNPVIKPLETTIEYPLRENIIVSTSRLSIKQKRQDVLLDAFSLVAQQDCCVQLKLIGDGPDEPFLKNKAIQLKLQDRIQFVGKSDTVLSEIKSAKVFAFSSDFEGMPNSILEALSMELPVVTTDYSPGGAFDLIENKNRGFVVPRNSPQLFAEKLLYVLTHDDEARIMAQNAALILDDLSEEKVISSWISYIKKYI